MADAYTSNYGLVKPDVGGSDDTWGEKLNANFDILDTILPTNSYVYISDTPPTVSGNNALWWESDTGILYIRHGGSWVVVSNLSAYATKTNPEFFGNIFLDDHILVDRDGTNTKIYAEDNQPHITITSNSITMADPVTLPGNPSDPLQASPKQYVDLGLGNTYTKAEADTKFVNVIGDTMSGDLIISKAEPQLALNKAASGQHSSVMGMTNAKNRWLLSLGNSEAESGGDLGSNFALHRYSDAGAHFGTAFSINRADGAATLGNHLRVNGAVHNWPLAVKTAANCNIGFYDSGTANTAGFGNLNDASNAWQPIRTESAWTFNSGVAITGNLGVNGGFELGIPGTAGPVFIDFHSGASVTDYDARIIQSSAGHIQILGNDVMLSHGLWSSTGYRTKAGVSAGFSGNWFNINHGTGQQLWIDNTNMGTIAFTSDYRVKKDVIDLPGMWETVKSLRPIKYTHTDFSPPSHKETQPLFAADDIERWGFIAHELQETLIEDAATGEKDSPDTIQSPNPWTVIAALTKALQEAMARIEALEAK